MHDIQRVKAVCRDAKELVKQYTKIPIELSNASIRESNDLKDGFIYLNVKHNTLFVELESIDDRDLDVVLARFRQVQNLATTDFIPNIHNPNRRHPKELHLDIDCPKLARLTIVPFHHRYNFTYSPEKSFVCLPDERIRAMILAKPRYDMEALTRWASYNNTNLAIFKQSSPSFAKLEVQLTYMASPNRKFEDLVASLLDPAKYANHRSP